MRNTHNVRNVLLCICTSAVLAALASTAAIADASPGFISVGHDGGNTIGVNANLASIQTDGFQHVMISDTVDVPIVLHRLDDLWISESNESDMNANMSTLNDAQATVRTSQPESADFAVWNVAAADSYAVNFDGESVMRAVHNMVDDEQIAQHRHSYVVENDANIGDWHNNLTERGIRV